MVLRLPRTIDDKSLLEDEPFKTHFAQRNQAKEGRKKGRSAFYVNLERAMREADGGLIAAEAWLRTAFGSEVTMDPPNIDAFIEFFWLLHAGTFYETKTHLYRVCKARGFTFHCDMSAAIQMPFPIQVPAERSVPPTETKSARKTRRVSKRLKKLDDGYDAEGEDDAVTSLGTERTLAVQASCVTAPFPVRTLQHIAPQDIPVSAPVKPKPTRKRKAKKDRPSSSGRSGSGSSDSALHRALYGPLTPTPSDAEECILPSISAPVAPTRANPPRQAAKKDVLKKLMKRETLYHRGMLKSSDDEARKITSISAPVPKQSKKPRKKTRAVSPSAESTMTKATAEAEPVLGTSAPMNLARVSPRRIVTRTYLEREKQRQRMLPPASRPSKKLKANDATPLTVVRSDDAQTSAAASESAVVKTSKKRSADQMNSDLPAGKTRSKQPARLIASLPKAKKGASNARGVSAPSMSRQSLGLSAADVNKVIQDVATAASETLNSTVDAASEWEVETPEQDHEDSADEEVPLRMLATRKATWRSNRSIAVVDVGPSRPAPSSQIRSDAEEDMPLRAAAPSASGRHTVLEDVASTPVGPAPFPSPVADPPQKRPLPAYPPIWAQSRQEVCESFDHFRSYQGGVYFAKDLARGYLLGGFSACRDLFHHNGKLIISHGGGKAESVHKTGGRFQAHEASDQLSGDKSVRSLLACHRSRRPVALLIDDKYALFPYDLTTRGCTYAVLGWYYVAHAWAECQPATNASGQVVRYKFAFQWCDGQDEPWWMRFANEPVSLDAQAGPSKPATSSDAFNSSSVYQSCHHCKSSSPQVYNESWMCLNPECRHFWTIGEKAKGSVPSMLTYSESFLKPIVGFQHVHDDIRPSLPIDRDYPKDAVTTSSHFCKGWHCEKCGRLSSRYKWEHWECRNCGHTYSISGRVRTALEFRGQRHAKAFDKHQAHSSIIFTGYKNFKSGSVYGQHLTYILPFCRGRIHVLVPSPIDHAADSILEDYQQQAVSGQLKFRRWPLRAHKCRGTLLTNYFSQNTGEPYQYVGGTENTVPFEVAPSAVLHALDLIKLRMKEASLDDAPFNEVLTAAYMEKQKMAFHSDSEKGLGPVVASLSLGASAMMYFRLHSQFAGELAEGGSREVLSLYLRHGEVLVMEGEGVQKFYEHTVVPMNFRVAATARCIGTGHR